MNNNMIKVITLSILTAMTVLTGCASKNTGTSEVMVYPLGYPNSNANAGYYDGGVLTANSDALMNAASQLQQAVYFGFDSSDITNAAAQVLSQHAKLLQAHPDARVVVGGHADERGSPEYNMVLGERRAKAVQAYLSSQGVDANRIETISYGEEQPAVQGSNEAAWAKNRRAELQY